MASPQFLNPKVNKFHHTKITTSAIYNLLIPGVKFHYFLGVLNSLNLKAPVSLLHVRWSVHIPVHRFLASLPILLAETPRLKKHTFLSPLISIKTCQKLHQFMIKKLLFTATH